MQRAGLSDAQKSALRGAGKLTIPGLVLWCRSQADLVASSDPEVSAEELAQEVEEEMQIASMHFLSTSEGAMEAPKESDDVEGEALKLAQLFAAPEMAWPSLHFRWAE